MVDLLEVILAEGADPSERADLDTKLEQAGHDIRARVDPAYKRATWGRRPEDAAATQSVITDLSGRRVR